MFSIYLLSPSILAQLKKFKSTISTNKSRTFCEDFFGLWTIGIMVINMWAYKDVVKEGLNMNKNPDSGMFQNSPRSIGAVIKYHGMNILIALITTLCSTILNICYHLYLKGPAQQTVDGGGKAGAFAKLWLTTCPMALGTGLAWRAVASFPLDVIPGPNKEKYMTVYVLIASLLRNLFFTHIIVWVMLRYQQRCKHLKMPTDVLKRSSSQFALEEFNRAFIKSLPFVFSWLWSDFLVFCVFEVGFGCVGGVCQGAPHTQFFVEIGYAMGLTLCALEFLPGLKEASARFKKLKKIYIATFLLSDKEAVQVQMVFDNLVVSFCGIAIGWAWTSPAATECNSLTLSPTCPKENTPASFLLFFAVTILYVFICVWIYHAMMENYRLHLRCNLILNIQDNSAARVFKTLDTNGDGKLSYDELFAFFEEAGIHSDVFMHAFFDLDHHTNGDDSVHVNDLMEQFERLLRLVRDEKYSADHSVLVRAHEEGLHIKAPHDPDVNLHANIRRTQEHHETTNQVIPHLNHPNVSKRVYEAGPKETSPAAWQTNPLASDIAGPSPHAPSPSPPPSPSRSRPKQRNASPSP